ncbi:MAG: thioredoxin family protein [Archangium sp.]|nr:thioredoxin family protein [Archangium sp.]
MTQKLVIGAAVALAVVAVVALRPGPAAAPTAASTASVPARLPKLLDLGAKTCIPCKAMVPILEGLRADYAGKLDVEFIDLFEDREAGEKWRVAIMPTQLFLSADGRELARHEGFLSREDILAQWKRLGVALD